MYYLFTLSFACVIRTVSSFDLPTALFLYVCHAVLDATRLKTHCGANYK